MSETTLDKNGFAQTDGIISVHNYSQLTGEYTGSGDVFLAKGVGIPAWSTTVLPPGAKTGYARTFSASEKTWSYVEDHRGEQVYDITTGAPVTVAWLGVIDTSNYTTDKPEAVPTPLKEQAASVQAWIQQQANLASAMGEVFTADMKAYVLAVNAIANGTDTTSAMLPTRPADVMEASAT